MMISCQVDCIWEPLTATDVVHSLPSFASDFRHTACVVSIVSTVRAEAHHGYAQVMGNQPTSVEVVLRVESMNEMRSDFLTVKMKQKTTSLVRGGRPPPQAPMRHR